MTNNVIYTVAYFDGNNNLMTIEKFSNGFPTDKNLLNALHSLCIKTKGEQKNATAVLTKLEHTIKTISL
jgi:ligand-binding sensor protein